MDQATQDRLAVNASNLFKRASTIVTLIATTLVGCWESLPQACDAGDAACTVSQALILSHLHMPSWLLAVLTLLVPYLIAAVWPQFSLKPHAPAVSDAKSAAGPATVDFPLETGPVPLSAVTLPPPGPGAKNQ